MCRSSATIKIFKIILHLTWQFRQAAGKFHNPAQTSSSSKSVSPSLRAKNACAFWSLGRTYNAFLTKMDALLPEKRTVRCSPSELLQYRSYYDNVPVTKWTAWPHRLFHSIQAGQYSPLYHDTLSARECHLNTLEKDILPAVPAPLYPPADRRAP